MPSSALGQFVLWLHRRAGQTGRLDTTCKEATEILDTLAGARNPPGTLTEAQIAGLELLSGRPRSELAKKIQRAAYRRLRSLDLVMLALDELGYTPVLVRSLLQIHFWELKQAPVGSEAHLICTDLSSAIDRATEKTKIVAFLLIAGFKPQEIGTTLKTNGSRRIGKAVRELSRILEGKKRGSIRCRLNSLP